MSLAPEKGLLLLRTDPAGCSIALDGVAAGDPCYISVGDYAANEPLLHLKVLRVILLL